MKNLFLILFAFSLFSCKKEEPCIDTGWYERNLLETQVHQEWAGDIEIKADSILVKFIVENKVVFNDTMYDQTEVFSLEKQTDYTIQTSQIPNVQSAEINVRQRYNDCSN